MEQILELIMSYAAIWAPSLVAVLAVITTIMKALTETKKAVEEFRNTDAIKSLHNEVQTLARENQEIVHCNKLLLDELTKIKNYADEMKKKGGN
jgi:uncharacterized protein YoxC